MANYWLLSSREDGELWPTFWRQKVVALGVSAVGDIRRFASREGLDTAYAAQWPAAKMGQRRADVTQLWGFARNIQVSELVFVRSYGAVIGIGEVQSDYAYLPLGDALRKRLHSEYFDDDYPHIRRVRWLSLWGGLKQSLAFTRLTLMP